MAGCDEKMLKQICMQASQNDDRIPFYVFDIDALKVHLKDIKNISRKYDVIFSMKANPMIICAVEEIVDGFEVSSAGELEICSAMGVSPDKISFTGVLKTAEDIRQAIDLGVRMISIESVEQLETMKKILALDFPEKTVSVMLRLTSNNQLGMDKEMIERLISEKESLLNRGIDIKGIHFFNGTQNKIEKTVEDIQLVSGFVSHIEDKYKIKIEFIEFGTGLRVDYFGATEQDRYFELRQLIENIKATGQNFRIEFGRFIAAYCGYYVAKVLDVKHNNGVNYAIMNGGKGHFTYYGSNNGMRTPQFIHMRNGEVIRPQQDAENWALCGPICNDMVVRSIKLPDVQKGDLFIFRNCGAYSALESMFLFLSRRLPEIYFYEKETMVRVRESIRSSDINTVSI